MWVSQNEGCWNSLITTQASRSRRALNRQEAFVCPDGCSLVSLVKSCAELRDVDRGRILHAEIARQGLLKSDVFAGNALVDMYAKCGLLAEAQEAFESLHVRDVVSWTALIGGYATHGFGMQALKCFEQMQLKEVIPNRVTYICILKACGCIGSTIMGRRLHDEVERRGLLKEDLAVGNALVDMYAKCGMLADTRRVFEQLPLRDKISWSALIMGCTKGREGAEALLCFRQMQIEGVFPDSITFICVLKACGSVKNTSKGKEMHAAILSRGLLEMNLAIANTLIHMYADCGSLMEAHEMFHKLSIRDIISWNSLIDGCVKQEHGEEALHWTERMQLEGIFPDIVTFVCCLKACGAMRAVHKGKELHAKVGSWNVEAVIGNALVDMYAKCGLISIAQEVFNKLKVRDVVTWTSLIAGYANHPSAEEALKCFQMMQVEGVSPNAATFVCVLKACGILGVSNKSIDVHSEIARVGFFAKDVVVGNALVDMYTKCGMLTKAHEVFNTLHVRDIVSWNALMAGYAKDDRGKEVLDCFALMKLEGVSLNSISFICSLKACGCMGATFEGIEIHTEIARKGLLSRDGLVGNALVNMYVKCGFLAKAKEVFHELPVQDIVSWNTLIAGYSQNENGEEALTCFEQMQQKGLSPNEVTFASILKACGSLGAPDKGSNIHVEIVKKGLLGKDSVLGTALVDMYAKCGAVAKAQQVCDELPVWDVVSWNVLIARYCQHGHGREALNCFQQMKCKGLSPDLLTFTCILKACGTIGAVEKGREIHDEIVRLGLLGNGIVLGIALLDMYASCGRLAKAQEVFDELQVRNAVSWNALVTGYCQHGHAKEALNCFEQMNREGVPSNAVTLACILKVCGSIGAAEKGKNIHDEIIRKGLLEKDIVLGNALVNMYASCGALAKAQQVFEELPVRDVVSWNVLIAGYCQHGLGEEALKCFEQMKVEGLSPSPLTFSCVVKACGTIQAAEKGIEIHDDIIKKAFLRENVVLHTALVDMYAKCGALSKAQQMFDELSVQGVVSWNALITGYCQQGHCKEAVDCFEHMLLKGLFPDAVTFTCILKACGSIGAAEKGKEIHAEVARQGLLEKVSELGPSLVHMYVKCGALRKARRVLEELPVRDVVSWNTLMAGYAQHEQGEDALNCLELMQGEGLLPDDVTFIGILKACGSIGAAKKGKQIHDEIARQGLLGKNTVLGTALVDMYAKCGAFVKAQQVLEEIPMENVVSWNALIAGYVQQGQGQEALDCFERMQHKGISPNEITFTCILQACGSIGAADKGDQVYCEIARQGLLENNIVLGTALVDMYAKCGALANAQRVLGKLPAGNVASWNALIAGYVQQGQDQEALNCYKQLQHKGFSPDEVTYTCILKACGSIEAVEKGEQIHNEIGRQGLLKNNIILGTAVVDMYAKCGALAKAQLVLEELPVENVVAWSALIAGYAQQGHGQDALSCFERMHCKGLSPDAVTFSSVLNACSHSGLVEEGEMYFANMSTKYGLTPDLEHYTCMVDLFGRAGHFDKAVAMIRKMPSTDHPTIWSVLLGACQKWAEVNVGRWAFERAVQVDKSDAAPYVCMLNIYTAAGMQENAKNIEAMRLKNTA